MERLKDALERADRRVDGKDHAVARDDELSERREIPRVFQSSPDGIFRWHRELARRRAAPGGDQLFLGYLDFQAFAGKIDQGAHHRFLNRFRSVVAGMHSCLRRLADDDRLRS